MKRLAILVLLVTSCGSPAPSDLSTATEMQAPDLSATTGRRFATGFQLPPVSWCYPDSAHCTPAMFKMIASGAGVSCSASGSTESCSFSGGGGGVSSVAMSVPSWLTVAGSPVTSSGTLAVTATSGQTANSVLATPNGSTGAVSLRALVAADIPAIAESGVTNLTSDLAAKAPLASPTFTGTATLAVAKPSDLKGNGSTPVPVPGTGAGTGGSTSMNGTNLAGMFSVTAGTSPANNATIATITFAGSGLASAPQSILFSPCEANAASLSGTAAPVLDLINNTSTAVMILKSGAANGMVNGTTYRWCYAVIE